MIPQIPHREICRLCHRVLRVSFWVPDDVWEAVVHPGKVDDIHCLDCFLTRADEKLIEWDKDIEFYAVSLKSNLKFNNIPLTSA